MEHGFVGQISSVPEPSTWAMLVAGAVAAGVCKWWRQGRKFLPFVALLFISSTAHAITIGSITLTDLGAGVVPNAINNNGQVVGQNASGQAFLWQNNTMTAISMPSGTQSVANDINDSGEVVGWFDNSSGLQHAFSWTSGTATDLSAGQSYSSAANAINDIWVSSVIFPTARSFGRQSGVVPA